MPTRQRFKNLASKFVNDTFSDFTKSFVIESKSTISDGQGGFTVTWATFASVTGFVTPQKGDKEIRDSHINTDQLYKFSYEYIDGVNDEMRINYNSETYNIKSVAPIKDNDIWVDILAAKDVAT